MANKEKLAHPLKVEKIIQETPDTKSLVFTIPPELGEDYRYEAGQFTSLFMNVGGEEIVRSYSLCTAPETDSEFKITIKKFLMGEAALIWSMKSKSVTRSGVANPKVTFLKNILMALT